MFGWIKNVCAAGQRLAAALNALAETAETVNAQTRQQLGLDALPPVIEGTPASPTVTPPALPSGNGEPAAASDETAASKRKRGAA